MKLLDALRAERTGRQRFDDFDRQPLLSVDCEKTGNVRHYTPDRNEEYALTAKVGVTFWANKAQYHHFLKDAEKALLAELFADILPGIAMLRSAVNDGDRMRCMQLLAAMETALKTGAHP